MANCPHIPNRNATDIIRAINSIKDHGQGVCQCCGYCLVMCHYPLNHVLTCFYCEGGNHYERGGVLGCPHCLPITLTVNLAIKLSEKNNNNIN